MKKRILSLLLAMVMCVLPFGTMVLATSTGKGESFDPGKITGDGGTLPSGTTTMVNGVFGAIKMACMIVAIFLVVFFGIKYLTAGAGEKAKTKEMMVPFLIGAALIMLAPTIVEWIWGIMGGSGSAS